MEKILILDFGGQYSHLIARRFRNLGFYAEIDLPSVDVSEFNEVKGVVLSGSPSSVYDKNAPQYNNKIFELNIPILGLCYGHQLLIREYGGTVEKSNHAGEYGFSMIEKISSSILFEDIDFPTQVWMSHGDQVVDIPDGFEVVASTKDCYYAAVQNINNNRYSLQFHPEVRDTIAGNIILNNFARICGMKKNWDDSIQLELISSRIKKAAGNKKVLVFLSGGVDSSVAYALLVKILGKEKVLGLYIDNGFMRHEETQAVKKRYNNAGFENIIFEDASKLFLDSVKNIISPQEKRKIIGETFLKVRDIIIKKMNLNEDDWLLAQGTLYPDIIESGGTLHADVIKTHHNRVEGIKQLLEKGLIIEPLKDLYKDEVRKIGKFINLPDEIIHRHPFPGPGISINNLCSNGKIDNNQNFNEIKQKLSNLNISKYFKDINYKLDLLPVKSVGVQGDNRTYSFPAVIDIIDFYKNFSSWENLETASSLLTNNFKDINRVIINIFSKNKCSLIPAYCTKERLDMIRSVDKIVLDELKKTGLYNKIFQHLTINLPYAKDNKSCSIVLRPVISEDVMTARFAHIELKILKNISDKIYKLNFVDSLFYDITNKPPATFGWE